MSGRASRLLHRCNNSAVIAVKSRYSKDQHLMHMLCCLFIVEAHSSFKVTAVHLPGTHNNLADNLPRNWLNPFLRKMEGADTTPSIIPFSLLQWLLHLDLDWTSPNYIQLFNSSVHRV